MLDIITCIAEIALCAARLDFENDILFFLLVRIPLSPIHFYFFLIYNFVHSVFFLFNCLFFIFFSLSIILFPKADIQQLHILTYVCMVEISYETLFPMLRESRELPKTDRRCMDSQMFKCMINKRIK